MKRRELKSNKTAVAMMSVIDLTLGDTRVAGNVPNGCYHLIDADWLEPNTALNSKCEMHVRKQFSNYDNLLM